MNRLVAIKILHTLIWIFMVAVIFYVLYSGFFNQINNFTWIGIAIILLEGIVLMLFSIQCPLTVLARKYSTSTKDNFDIYLPNWLARYNKLIFTTIFIVGLISVLLRLTVEF